jgi:hypothetical protein
MASLSRLTTMSSQHERMQPPLCDGLLIVPWGRLWCRLSQTMTLQCVGKLPYPRSYVLFFCRIESLSRKLDVLTRFSAPWLLRPLFRDAMRPPFLRRGSTQEAWCRPDDKIALRLATFWLCDCRQARLWQLSAGWRDTTSTGYRPKSRQMSPTCGISSGITAAVEASV